MLTRNDYRHAFRLLKAELSHSRRSASLPLVAAYVEQLETAVSEGQDNLSQVHDILTQIQDILADGEATDEEKVTNISALFEEDEE